MTQKKAPSKEQLIETLHALGLKTVEQQATVLRQLYELIDGQDSFDERITQALERVKYEQFPELKEIIIKIYEKWGDVKSQSKLLTILGNKQLTGESTHDASLRLRALLRLLADERARVREKAMEKIIDLSPSVIHDILLIVSSSDLEEKRCALLALGRLSSGNDKAMDVIITHLAHEVLLVSCAAAIALTECSHGNFADIQIHSLVKQLELSKSSIVRESIIIALLRARDISSEVREQLAQDLINNDIQAKNLNLRKHAINLLEKIQDTLKFPEDNVLRTIAKNLLESNNDLRVAAASFLSKYMRQGLDDVLFDMRSSLIAADHHVDFLLCDALKRIGTGKAKELVEELSNSSDSSVRKRAHDVLIDWPRDNLSADTDVVDALFKD